VACFTCRLHHASTRYLLVKKRRRTSLHGVLDEYWLQQAHPVLVYYTVCRKNSGNLVLEIPSPGQGLLYCRHQVCKSLCRTKNRKETRIHSKMTNESISWSNPCGTMSFVATARAVQWHHHEGYHFLLYQELAASNICLIRVHTVPAFMSPTTRMTNSKEVFRETIAVHCG